MSKPRDYDRTEIGQLALAGNDLFDFDVDTYVERGLEELDEVIREAKLCPSGWTGEPWTGPASNVGAEVETPVFAMRSYCWCDCSGDHKDGCPPNFHHFESGFKVNWYKWLSRGTQQNRAISRKEWRDILEACVASLPGGAPL